MSYPSWAPPPSGRDVATIIMVDIGLWTLSLWLVVSAVHQTRLGDVASIVVSVPLCLAAAWLSHRGARLVAQNLAWRRLRRRLDDELG